MRSKNSHQKIIKGQFRPKSQQINRLWHETHDFKAKSLLNSNFLLKKKFQAKKMTLELQYRSIL